MKTRFILVLFIFLPGFVFASNPGPVGELATLFFVVYPILCIESLIVFIFVITKYFKKSIIVLLFDAITAFMIYLGTTTISSLGFNRHYDGEVYWFYTGILLACSFVPVIIPNLALLIYKVKESMRKSVK